MLFHAPCDGPLLNSDVIFHLLSLLPKAELLVTMLTCRALHSAGKKHLLQVCAEIPLQYNRVEPFMRFMLNNPDYFRHLRTLGITLAAPSLARMGARTLSQCHSLEVLCMIIWERMFRDVPELDQAICALPRLTELTIKGAVKADRIARWIMSMNCPLRILRAPFRGKMSQDASIVLQSVAEQLEVLDIHGISFPRAGSRLPRVHSADVTFTDFNHDTGLLLDWLPAITDLVFSKPRYGDNEVPPAAFWWDKMRKTNESRRLSGRSPQLQSVQGHLLSMYSSALAHEVHRLCCDHVEMLDAERLSTLLIDLRPYILDLHIVLPPEECHRLPGLLQEASNVTQLMICIEFNRPTNQLAELVVVSDDCPLSLVPQLMCFVASSSPDVPVIESTVGDDRIHDIRIGRRT